MRWIRFTAEDRTRYGILEGDRILEVSGSPLMAMKKPLASMIWRR